MTAYLRYADQLKLKCDIVYDSDSAWSLLISGEGCWDRFYNESGKHVVQRVPPTEARGRRHTSVVAVAVLPLFNNADAPLVVTDVDIITQCGHGKGGQNQNRVHSAVRALHRPSGISVFINGRDQFRNKQLAMEILQARVADESKQVRKQEHDRLKGSQLGYGSRSGKIRTYNFITGIVSDHRTGNRVHKIAEVMKGRFDLLK